LAAEKYYWIMIAIVATPTAAIFALSYSSLVSIGIVFNISGNLSYPLVALYLVLTTFSLFCYFAMKLDDKNRAGPLLGVVATLELLSFVINYVAARYVFGFNPACSSASDRFRTFWSHPSIWLTEG
jgi:uncharacterized membrane protein YhaH (DUF805 family)